MCQQPRDPEDASSLALWRAVPPQVGLLPRGPKSPIYRPCCFLRGRSAGAPALGGGWEMLRKTSEGVSLLGSSSTLLPSTSSQAVKNVPRCS